MKPVAIILIFKTGTFINSGYSRLNTASGFAPLLRKNDHQRQKYSIVLENNN